MPIAKFIIIRVQDNRNSPCMLVWLRASKIVPPVFHLLWHDWIWTCCTSWGVSPGRRNPNSEGFGQLYTTSCRASLWVLWVGGGGGGGGRGGYSPQSRMGLCLWVPGNYSITQTIVGRVGWMVSPHMWPKNKAVGYSHTWFLSLWVWNRVYKSVCLQQGIPFAILTQEHGQGDYIAARIAVQTNVVAVPTARSFKQGPNREQELLFFKIKSKGDKSNHWITLAPVVVWDTVDAVV